MCEPSHRSITLTRLEERPPLYRQHIRHEPTPRAYRPLGRLLLLLAAASTRTPGPAPTGHARGGPSTQIWEGVRDTVPYTSASRQGGTARDGSFAPFLPLRAGAQRLQAGSASNRLASSMRQQVTSADASDERNNMIRLPPYLHAEYHADALSICVIDAKPLWLSGTNVASALHEGDAKRSFATLVGSLKRNDYQSLPALFGNHCFKFWKQLDIEELREPLRSAVAAAIRLDAISIDFRAPSTTAHPSTPDPPRLSTLFTAYIPPCPPTATAYARLVSSRVLCHRKP